MYNDQSCDTYGYNGMYYVDVNWLLTNVTHGTHGNVRSGSSATLRSTGRQRRQIHT